MKYYFSFFLSLVLLLATLHFYEILFLVLWGGGFSTCSQLQKNNENARNKEIVLFNVTEKISTVTPVT